jgi:hypothetical protein
MKLELVARAGIDWLTLTKRRDDRLDREIETARDFLHPTGEDAPPRHGFTGIQVSGYGALLHKDRHMMIILPAQAIQFFRNTHRATNHLIHWAIDHRYKATRIDLTIDSNDPQVTPQLAMKHWDAGAVTCRAESARPWTPPAKKGTQPPNTGWTFYIGSPKADRMMRIYDKKKELEDKLQQEVAHLTRFELQNRADCANATMNAVAAHGIAAIRQIIAGWVDFKELTGRSEIYKRPSADWWSRIVNDKIKLGLLRDIATPQRTLRWLKSEAVARALKLAIRFNKWTEIQEAMDQCEIPDDKLMQWQNTYEPPPPTAPPANLWAMNSAPAAIANPSTSSP